MIRRHIIFYGRVQGVGFRYFSTQKARELGLTGYVKNLYNGNVEMEVQGPEEKIDALILHLEHVRWIRIDSMSARSMPLVEERGFRELPSDY